MLSVNQVAAATAEPVSVLEAKNHIRVLTTETSDDALIAALITSARESAETYTRRALMCAQYRLVLDQLPRPSADAATGNWWGPIFGVSPGPLVATRNDGTTGFEVFLPYPPLVSVDSFFYIDDTTGVKTLLDPSQYAVDTTSEPARITPAYGVSWPSVRNQPGAVEITFTAGYAAQFTATAAQVTLAIAGPKPAWAVNDAVRFANSGGALPAGLSPLTSYYVNVVNPLVVSATPGGANIAPTDAGTGTHYVYTPRTGFVPAGVRAWMLLRIGTLYQNREEVAVLNRGTVQLLPFVDSLMRPHRVAR